MAVNLLPPLAKDLRAIKGVELGFAMAGIRKAHRNDLMLMRLAAGSRVAGVFTQNSFAAAPVKVCREHLRTQASIRALIVNAGNANCGTGQHGIDAANQTCAIVAAALGCEAAQVLPFSTGVILERLPVDRIERAVPDCVASLGAAEWANAAAAIMTTDTVPKGVSRSLMKDGHTISITGIAKGVGMLQPNMATMLAYVATDAAIAPQLLNALVKDVADQSFNRVTVDGDTSTNDSFILIATGCAGTVEITDAKSPEYGEIRQAILEVACHLAQSIARDGEGATKFVTVDVEGAATDDEAVRVAKSIAHSPLVKTAMFASDPNLGRLLMAIGNAGVTDMDTSKVELFLGDVKVVERGERAATYREEDGARVMKAEELNVRVELNRGVARTTVWTCDFSYDYVKINAEYRT